MEAGGALFSRQGYDGTTVEEIATRARVNKAMISYHFRGKEGLYGAILAATLGPVVARLEAVRREPIPPDRQLAKVIATFHELARTHPAFPAMMLREVISEHAHAVLEPMAYPVAVLGIVRDILERGIAEGLFRQVPVLAVHLTTVGSLMLFFAAQPVRERIQTQAAGVVTIPPDEEYVHHVTELILRGLAAGPASPPTYDRSRS